MANLWSIECQKRLDISHVGSYNNWAYLKDRARYIQNTHG